MESRSGLKELELLTQFHKVFSDMCSGIALKCAGFLIYVSANYFFDLVQADALIALVVLIIFDFITGVIASRKTGVAIRSSIIFRTPVKIFSYFLLISGGHLAEVVIGVNFFIDDIILSFLGVTELISILENVSKMGYAVPQKLLATLNQFRSTK